MDCVIVICSRHPKLFNGASLPRHRAALDHRLDTAAVAACGRLVEVPSICSDTFMHLAAVSGCLDSLWPKVHVSGASVADVRITMGVMRFLPNSIQSSSGGQGMQRGRVAEGAGLRLKMGQKTQREGEDNGIYLNTLINTVLAACTHTHACAHTRAHKHKHTHPQHTRTQGLMHLHSTALSSGYIYICQLTIQNGWMGLCVRLCECMFVCVRVCVLIYAACLCGCIYLPERMR